MTNIITFSANILKNTYGENCFPLCFLNIRSSREMNWKSCYLSDVFLPQRKQGIYKQITYFSFLRYHESILHDINKGSLPWKKQTQPIISYLWWHHHCTYFTFPNFLAVNINFFLFISRDLLSRDLVYVYFYVTLKLFPYFILPLATFLEWSRYLTIHILLGVL